MKKAFISAAAAAVVAATCGPAAAQLVRSAAGSDAATVTPARNQFRLDLGGGVVPAANGLFSDATGARREINWDGVPDGFSAPNNLPANFFNLNSPRGVVFSTPGTGLQLSATLASGTPVDFGNIDPSYAGTFATFSPQRLFTALGSNVVDVLFFVPGTATPALTEGFGAIFTDVDLPNTTSIEYFDAGNASLGTFFVPNVAGADETLSFLGVSYADPIVSRVRITSGNAAPALGTLDGPSDIVTMDDFLYGEPVVAQVPEPATLLLVGAAVAGFASRRRRKEA